MDNPIFKLEKVVQPKNGESLEDFEGPLDPVSYTHSDAADEEDSVDLGGRRIIKKKKKKKKSDIMMI